MSTGREPDCLVESSDYVTYICSSKCHHPLPKRYGGSFPNYFRVPHFLSAENILPTAECIEFFQTTNTVFIFIYQIQRCIRLAIFLFFNFRRALGVKRKKRIKQKRNCLLLFLDLLAVIKLYAHSKLSKLNEKKI